MDFIILCVKTHLDIIVLYVKTRLDLFRNAVIAIQSTYQNLHITGGNVKKGAYQNLNITGGIVS